MKTTNQKVIAYDLGTGGIKASLFTAKGEVIYSVFESYATFYPATDQQEQAPQDWWSAVVSTTKKLLSETKIDAQEIVSLALSGHSLGVVPIGKDGSLLRETTPIWSDKRAEQEAESFFEKIDYKHWYMTTGGGFPPACYSIFKIMWYKANESSLYDKLDKVIGTKDYCNYRFTGCLCTDYSYASGSRVFDLKQWDYDQSFIEAAGIDSAILPEIVASDEVIGTLTDEAAAETGLPKHVKVVCGGVDNSCMALGAKGIMPSRIYTSLGSSAWIALISDNPVLDFGKKPYVFAHVIKGLYASATCIFSAGSSLQWVRNIICSDFLEKEQQGGEDAYVSMNKLAEEAPIGSNGVLFNPSLAGGSMLEPTPDMRGAFTGLQLCNTRNDMIRATMEGIALNLRIALDLLKQYAPEINEMLIVGGGAKSKLWMQIFADCYGLPIEKTNIDQAAASLGAAALALKGTGIWSDYSPIDTIHQQEQIFSPLRSSYEEYNLLLYKFKTLQQRIASLESYK